VVLDLAFDFGGVRRFWRRLVFSLGLAAVRALDVFFAFFAFLVFFAFLAFFALFALLAAPAFRALAFALLSARTFAARASSSLNGSASLAATTLQGLVSFVTGKNNSRRLFLNVPSLKLGSIQPSVVSSSSTFFFAGRPWH
jgi:hypothetical protein